MTERDIAAETRALLEGLTAPDILNHVMPAIAGAFWDRAAYDDGQTWLDCLNAAAIPPTGARVRLLRERASMYLAQADAAEQGTEDGLARLAQAIGISGGYNCGQADCPACGTQPATVTLPDSNPDSNGTSDPVAYL